MINKQHNKRQREIIQAYLIFMNNIFPKVNSKEHLLFVEGYTDKEFYCDVFKNVPQLDIDEKNICINFSVGKNADKYNGVWIEKFGNPYSKQNEAKEIVAKTMGKFKNYDFVIAATHKDNLPDKNCKIDCFGFIDRDFGHKDDIDNKELTFYKPRKLAQTTFHDRETTLIFYYLPQLYHLLKKDKSDAQNSEFIARITDILYFTTCQGVLERYSIDNDAFDMYKITHENFRDPSEWQQYGLVENFDFFKYLEATCNGEGLNPMRKALLNGVVADCKKEIEKIKKEEVELEVNKWLGGLNEGAPTDLLSEVFLNSNGHILCENIVKGTWKYLGIKGKKESELINLFIPLIKEDDRDFKKTSPIKEYIQYRKDLQNS